VRGEVKNGEKMERSRKKWRKEFLEERETEAGYI
jgi:hypothetical protein